MTEQSDTESNRLGRLQNLKRAFLAGLHDNPSPIKNAASFAGRLPGDFAKS
jgi:hypothetical protein